MIFDYPMTFAEALDAARVRSLLPTTGTSAELRGLESAVKRRAMMSATVDVASRLQRFAEGVDAILTGEASAAEVRAALKAMLASEGYAPDPEKAGGLQDLGSSARLNLIIETNVATAEGFGRHVQGLQPAVLDEYPAQELFDAAPGGEHRRDWAERWRRAGGEFVGRRLVALKKDRVWERLGDPALFADGLGNPYPPYAYGSKWDVRDIDRDETVALELMRPGEAVTPPEQDDLSLELRATPEIREAWLREAITEQGLGQITPEGVLVFGGGDS